MPTAIDVSAVLGLTAMALFTLNILLGLLVTTNYNPRRLWPRRKIPIFKIHNWTGYGAISLVCLHPTVLLFSNTAGFHVTDVLYPVHSPGQRLYNCLGACTFYLFVVVVATSYLRPRLGFRPWKRLHWLAYLAGGVMFVHGTLIDPYLKGNAPDFLDGEKVFVEGCFVLAVAATLVRRWYGKEKQRHPAKPGVA